LHSVDPEILELKRKHTSMHTLLTAHLKSDPHHNKATSSSRNPGIQGKQGTNNKTPNIVVRNGFCFLFTSSSPDVGVPIAFARLSKSSLHTCEGCVWGQVRCLHVLRMRVSRFC
jgi:hypothetical protein